MYKNNKSNKSKRLHHLDNDDVYAWDNYDLHHQYNEEIDSFPPTMKQNTSTQTYTKITTCICNTCHHPYNEEIASISPVKIKRNVSTQTPPQIHEVKYIRSIAQKHPKVVKNLSTKRYKNISVQTESQKENKFSLFRFLIFLINNFY